MPWNIPLSYADTSNFLLHMQNINGSSSRDKLMAILNSCQHSSLRGFEETRARSPAMPKRPFYGMFDHHEDECSSDTHGLHHVEKKRRLTADQVRSLELSFEMENKLEPERKMQLAQQLGLQPRQIAVWFQNRRARWKTKQLERVYDALKVDFDTVLAEKEKLQAEVKRLTAQLEATNNGRKGNDIFVKNETDIREGKTNEDNSEVERSQTVEQIDSLGEVNQQAILLESLNEFKDFSDENDKNGDVGSAADHDQQAGSVNNGSVDHYDHDNASPIEAPIPSDATFTAQDIYNLSFAPMLDVENEPYSLHYHESDWPTGVLDSWTWLIA